MAITYRILTKSDKISTQDWLTLEKKIKPFTSWFTITVKLENNTFYFFLTTAKPLDLVLSNHPTFLFKPLPHKEAFKTKAKLAFKPASRFPSLFATIEKNKLKHSKQLTLFQISWHKLIFTHYRLSYTYLKNSKLETSASISFSPPYPIISLDFSSHHLYKIKKHPKFTNPHKIKSLLTNTPDQKIFEVDLFPHFSQPLYLSIDKLDLTKHSLIVGQTGTGKSKLIELITSRLTNQSSFPYHIIFIDPHLSLAQTIHAKYPDRSTFIDFLNSSVPLFPTLSQPQTATELTILLFKTLLADQFNPYLRRLLRYILFTLYLTNSASLENLNRFLTEEDYKNQFIDKLPDQYDHIRHFFDTDFIKYQTQYYETAFIPIVSLLEELNFLPKITANNQKPLAHLINSSPITLFALDKLRLGSLNTKLISGLITQQIFLLAQAGRFKKPILLIIDEAPLVENEAFATILSQSRKFNLSLMLSYQYLNQTHPSLLESLKANVYNYFVFKVSDNDAKLITNLIELKTKKPTAGKADSSKLQLKLLTSLNPRHLFVRLFHSDKFYPAFKAKTAFINNQFLSTPGVAQAATPGVDK
ncbi:MAG: ATP-binding protein [bacterium]|nr:ATP-binding protein [bacterium]